MVPNTLASRMAWQREATMVEVWFIYLLPGSIMERDMGEAHVQGTSS